MQRAITVISRHARPLCENAHAHGWRVCMADGFNDWDGARFALPLTPGGFGKTPEEFLRTWETAPGPLLFGSPIEAAPEVVGEAGRKKRVLNASSRAVAMARDLSFLREMATGGIRVPPVSFYDAPPNPPEMPWIVKSLITAGGTGIRPGGEIKGKDEYRQQLIEGESIGALFFSSAGRSDFLGASIHLNHGFLYGGGIFPVPLASDVVNALESFGVRVTAASGMIGWWGADFILNDEALWLLEINPRPTATAALFAGLRGVDLVAAQMSPEDAPDFSRASSGGVIGNKVIYARHDLTFHGSAEWFARNARDIPHEASVIANGAPVLTLYAEGTTMADCRAVLDEKTAAAYAAFAGRK